jgi:hypothetical protein
MYQTGAARVVSLLALSAHRLGSPDFVAAFR